MPWHAYICTIGATQHQFGVATLLFGKITTTYRHFAVCFCVRANVCTSSPVVQPFRSQQALHIHSMCDHRLNALPPQVCFVYTHGAHGLCVCVRALSFLWMCVGTHTVGTQTTRQNHEHRYQVCIKHTVACLGCLQCKRRGAAG